jgi:hypothetical protein
MDLIIRVFSAFLGVSSAYFGFPRLVRCSFLFAWKVTTNIFGFSITFVVAKVALLGYSLVAS